MTVFSSGLLVKACGIPGLQLRETGGTQIKRQKLLLPDRGHPPFLPFRSTIAEWKNSQEFSARSMRLLVEAKTLR